MLSKKENLAVRAMQLLQKQMKHEVEETGLVSEERIMDVVKEVRSERENIIRKWRWMMPKAYWKR